MRKSLPLFVAAFTLAVFILLLNIACEQVDRAVGCHELITRLEAI